jgi:ABC-type enterochelin transport system permease subunit
MAPVGVDITQDRTRGYQAQLSEAEMERTLISWNLPNWITVTIMAAASYAVLGLIAQLLKQQQAAAGQAGG